MPSTRRIHVCCCRIMWWTSTRCTDTETRGALRVPGSTCTTSLLGGTTSTASPSSRAAIDRNIPPWVVVNANGFQRGKTMQTLLTKTLFVQSQQFVHFCETCGFLSQTDNNNDNNPQDILSFQHQSASGRLFQLREHHACEKPLCLSFRS